MIGDGSRIGLVHSEGPSDEQRAAAAWLRERAAGAVVVPAADLDGSADSFDVLWWHRAAPLDDVASVAEPLADFLAGGGNLLLSLRAMGAVEALGIDPVPPDAIGVERVTEPVGPLWRRLYDDHPAVSAFDSRRIPVCDRGAVPTARYEGVVPSRGEVLASTVRGGHDVPREMRVVSWDGGSVLGVGAPLSFAEPAAPEVAEARSAFTAGCLSALADDPTGPSRPTSTADFEGLRTRLSGDPHRPRYHFTPPANWLNDPNGLIRWNGRYHLFYQYNPAGPFHNSIHWGHATSEDLLHWQDEPVALAPSPDGPDRDGCWSGCAVDDDGTPTILYTGGNGRRQLPCLATSTDPRLGTWRKDPDNPVIAAPPSDLDLLSTEHWEAEFRDHAVWGDGDTWYQLIGSGVADEGGVVLLYSSPDLRAWEYEGPLLVGDDGHGTVWECPELLDLGDRSLLHVSNYEDVVYFLGGIHEGAFEVEARGVLDHGDFYAPQSLRDGDRLLTWGWLPEARGERAQWDAGYREGAVRLDGTESAAGVRSPGDVREGAVEEAAARRCSRVG